MLRILTYYDDKSMMHIRKSGLRSTYIFVPDVQTYKSASDNLNLKITSHVPDLTL